MRRITVHEVTAALIKYTVEVYTPFIGWDGVTKSSSHMEWKSRYPYHVPKKGKTFIV